MPVDLRIGGAIQGGGAASTAVGAPRIAGAFRDVDTALQDLFIEDTDPADRLRSVELEGAARRGYAAGLSELDPTAPDYIKRADEVYRTVTEDTMAETGIQSREISERLGLSLAAQRQSGLGAADATRREALEVKGLALFDERADAALAQARQNPDLADDLSADFAAAAGEIGPMIGAQALEERLAAVSDQMIEAQVEGLALGGRHGEAKALLAAAQGELTPEANRALGRRLREIQGRQESERHTIVDGKIADIGIRIIDAAGSADLRDLRTEVDAMHAAGEFDGKEQARVTLTRRIEAQHSKLVKGNQDLLIAQNKFASGFDTPKEAGLVWAEQSKQIPEDATAQERVSAHTEFVRQGGIMPPQTKRFLKNAERIDKPDQLAFAAQLDEQLRQDTQVTDTGAGEKSALVQSYHNIGMDWTEAAKLTLERSPDQATAKARDEAFDEEHKDTDWQEWIEDEGLAPERGMLGIIGLGDEPAISDTMAADAQRAVRSFYQLNGDIDAAEDAAVTQLGKVYGNTTVGGQLRVQKHPPERHFPVGDMDQREQMIDGMVRREMAAIGSPLPDLEDGRNYQLVDDIHTQRRIDAGLPPDYEVWVRSNTGDLMFPAAAETADGRRIKVRLTMPTKEAAKQLPEVIDAMAQSRARSERGSVLSRAGSAIHEAIGPDERGFRERHPFSGFITNKGKQ